MFSWFCQAWNETVPSFRTTRVPLRFRGKDWDTRQLSSSENAGTDPFKVALTPALPSNGRGRLRRAVSVAWRAFVLRRPRSVENGDFGLWIEQIALQSAIHNPQSAIVHPVNPESYCVAAVGGDLEPLDGIRGDE